MYHKKHDVFRAHLSMFLAWNCHSKWESVILAMKIFMPKAIQMYKAMICFSILVDCILKTLPNACVCVCLFLYLLHNEYSKLSFYYKSVGK